MPKPNPRFSRRPKREAGFRKLEGLDRLALACITHKSLEIFERCGSSLRHLRDFCGLLDPL
jgi:hypothetical protein